MWVEPFQETFERGIPLRGGFPNDYVTFVSLSHARAGAVTSLSFFVLKPKRLNIMRPHRGRGEELLNRNLGRGVRPTQRNPDPVQDTKDVNFATLSERKCYNFFTLFKTGPSITVFKAIKTVHKFAFSRISTKAHEISENYVIEGGEKERICGEDPVQDTKMWLRQRTLKMIPWLAERPYQRNIWENPYMRFKSAVCNKRHFCFSRRERIGRATGGPGNGCECWKKIFSIWVRNKLKLASLRVFYHLCCSK